MNCPICGSDYLVKPSLRTPEHYHAACIVLKDNGLDIADGDTEEEVDEQVESGMIDPWWVCASCVCDEEGNMYS